MKNPFESYGRGGHNLRLAPALNTVVALILGLCCALSIADSLQAQGLQVSAQISGQAAGGGMFNYTITLNNAMTSASSVGTFWYSWVPGENFLPSNPSSLNPPTGWGAVITHAGAGDGFGIEFTTTTTPLDPGSSLDFGFSSSDSPSAIAGDSPYYPGTPVGTSFVYSGAPFSSSSLEFVVQSVPEPASLRLLGIGLGGILILSCITRRWRNNSGRSAAEHRI